MGTHPIFESDFDCLTEKKTKQPKWESRTRISCARSSFIQLQSTILKRYGCVNRSWNSWARRRTSQLSSTDASKTCLRQKKMHRAKSTFKDTLRASPISPLALPSKMSNVSSAKHGATSTQIANAQCTARRVARLIRKLGRNAMVAGG